MSAPVNCTDAHAINHLEAGPAATCPWHSWSNTFRCWCRSKPISGGIPHCFPQFGPGDMQQHGFARNLDWSIASTSADLQPDDRDPQVWFFEARVCIDSIDCHMGPTCNSTSREHV